MATEVPTGSALSNLLSNPHDATAQERFVADYGPSLQQWCRTLCAQPADADDLYQTVWCKLLEQMQTFRYDSTRGRFRGWLRTVAHNTWINMVKSIKPIAFGGSRTIDETHSDWEKMIDEFWDRELFLEAIRRVRPRLNVGTWEAFELNALEGRAAAEVAQLTGKSVASIHVLKGRVTKMLPGRDCEAGWFGPGNEGSDMSQCPSRPELQRFVVDDLDATDSGTIESHVDHCDRCTDVLKSLTADVPTQWRAWWQEVGPPAPPSIILDIDRYTVREELGRGGFGAVYRLL